MKLGREGRVMGIGKLQEWMDQVSMVPVSSSLSAPFLSSDLSRIIASTGLKRPLQDKKLMKGNLNSCSLSNLPAGYYTCLFSMAESLGSEEGGRIGLG